MAYVLIVYGCFLFCIVLVFLILETETSRHREIYIVLETTVNVCT